MNSSFRYDEEKECPFEIGSIIFRGEIMNFTIETTDIDLGDTPIENIFINDFMPMANGTYVKVYL